MVTKTGPTLAQIMACCLMAVIHQTSMTKLNLKSTFIKIHLNFSVANELTSPWSSPTNTCNRFCHFLDWNWKCLNVFRICHLYYSDLMILINHHWFWYLYMAEIDTVLTVSDKALLTLNVGGPRYLRLTGSISWLLMHWLLALGWVGLWGFLWWAPSAKGKDQLWMEQCLTPLKYWPI